MIRRVADRIAPVIDDLVLNCRADQVAAIAQAIEGYQHDHRFAEDPEADLGPMAGIRTGLRAAASEYALVVACDMPFVDAVLVTHCFDVATGHDAAVPRLDDQWFQTTQAVYHSDAMAAACERALDRGDRKILAALEELDYVVVEEPAVRDYASLDTFENVNTQADLANAADRLRSR